MTKELVISGNRHETKLAVLEDDQLVEIYFQRFNEYSLVGSIHKGRVTRVLPGMQSAFVDLGLERDAFLYVSDFFDEGGEDYERVSSVGESGRRRAPAPPPVASPEPVAAAAAAPPVPSGEGAASGVAQVREGRDARPGDRGDRRGRRSRRRRSRGRGFPENKYTSAEAVAAPAAAPIIEPEPAEEQGGDFEALVLPGESLAKYRGRSPLEADQAVNDFEPDAPDQDAEEELEASAAPETRNTVQAEEAITALESHPLVTEDPDDSGPDPMPLTPGRLEAGLEEVEARAAVDEIDFGEPDAEAFSSEQPAAEVAGEMEETDFALEVSAGEISEAASELAEIEEETAEPEEGAAPQEPLEAGIREQPAARYIARGQRRVRRRGGRGPEFAEGGRPGRPEHQTVSRPDRDRDKDRDRDRDRDREKERGAERAERERPPLPSISDLLKEGQEIIVQIAKEPLGQKGARITSHLAMPGRYVVYMPTIDHAGGVSRKISSDEERQRLKRILQTHSEGMTGGFIVRTAGEGRTEAEIAADMTFLFNQWMDIRKKAEKRPAPCLLHHDLELVTRTLRDQVNENFKAVWVDNEEIYENVLRFLERFQPSLVNRVKLYTRPMPIFDTFNITAELEKALRPKVWLKSGGYIVINQTEALVAIDINTGKYVGKSNRLEDTIVKTNIEAIKEIVRQVRLRDLGGIIVVDFIDMDERKNRQKVMQALEEAMRSDRAPYKILQFNDFGLVAITRRRVKQSLERALCSSCPTCEGAGYVKAVATVVGEIINEAHKIAAALEGKDVMLRVNPDVAKFLKANEEHYLEELEEILGRQVIIKSDALLHPEKFDLA
jgi:ribonuclease G